MMGVLRLEKLKLLAALPMLAIYIESAYSFDNSRFYTRNWNSVGTSRWRPAEKILAMSPDDYVLAPSDEVSKDAGMQAMNKNVSQSRAKHENSGDLRRLEMLNIIYSLNSEPDTLAMKCGPSPMKPTEIENLVGVTAETYGVDSRLAKAIAWTESRFDQIRNSPKGARGPMQLMPETASDLGVRDVCDPASNIDGGVRHLRALLDEFKNPLVAAAAYNAGSQAVYDNGGIPPYGETIRYVAAVINHQLGLPIRNARHAASRGALSANKPSQSGHQSTSVIGTRAGQFVDGVMHF